MCNDLGLARAQVPAQNVRGWRFVLDDEERRDRADRLKGPIAIGLGANLIGYRSRNRDPIGQRAEEPESVGLAQQD